MAMFVHYSHIGAQILKQMNCQHSRPWGILQKKMIPLFSWILKEEVCKSVTDFSPLDVWVHPDTSRCGWSRFSRKLFSHLQLEIAPPEKKHIFNMSIFSNNSLFLWLLPCMCSSTTILGICSASWNQIVVLYQHIYMIFWITSISQQ